MLRAIVVVCLFLTMSVSALADSVPAGWERNDYIAYLILSNFLTNMTMQGDDIFVACVGYGVAGMGDPRRDPSPQLMKALVQKFATGGRHVPLRLDSQCIETPGRVEERETGAAAMFVSVTVGKGGGTASWHHASLWGGGTLYEVHLGQDPPSVTPNGGWDN
jgi:hypothetical protein